MKKIFFLLLSIFLINYNCGTVKNDVNEKFKSSFSIDEMFEVVIDN